MESPVHPIVGCHGTVGRPTVWGTVEEASISTEMCFTSRCLATTALSRNMSQYFKN
jgi:hypothetical protein